MSDLVKEAKDLWLRRKTQPKLKPKAVAGIWDTLWHDRFHLRLNGEIVATLNQLECLQLYLWPLFHEDAGEDHILLICTLTRYSDFLDEMVNDADKFVALFFRVRELLDSDDFAVKCVVVDFFNYLLCSLHLKQVRQLIGPIFSSLSLEDLPEELVQKYQILRRESMFPGRQLILQKNFLHSLATEFVSVLGSDSTEFSNLYVQTLTRFFVTCLSQLPTRQVVLVLLWYLNVPAISRTTQLDPTTKRGLDVLRYYAKDPSELMIDLSTFQKIAFEKLGDKALEFAIAAPYKVEKSLEELLPDAEQLCSAELIYGNNKMASLRERLFTEPLSFCLPTESSLESAIDISGGTQYLSVSEFLTRSQLRNQFETFVTLKQEILKVCDRMRVTDIPQVKARGSSKFCSRLTKLTIHDHQPSVTESVWPKAVHAEALLDFGQGPKKDWDELVQGDIVFLLQLRAPQHSSKFLEKTGLVRLRTAFIVDSKPTLKKRKTIHLNIDPQTFVNDKNDVYTNMNFIMRYNHKQLNKANDIAKPALPHWFHDLFLGIGKPPISNPFDFIFPSAEAVQNAFPDSNVVIDTQTKKRKAKLTGPVKVFMKDDSIDIEPFVTLKSCSTPLHAKAMIKCLSGGAQLIETPSDVDFCLQLIDVLLLNEKRVVVVAATEEKLEQLQTRLHVAPESVLNLCSSLEYLSTETGHVTSQLESLAESLGLDPVYGSNYHNSRTMFLQHIQPAWLKYLKEQAIFPFEGNPNSPIEATKIYKAIVDLFQRSETLFRLQINSKESAKLMLHSYSRVILTTPNAAKPLIEPFSFDSVVYMDSFQLNDFDCMVPLMLQAKPIERAIFVGDPSLARHPSLHSRLANQGLAAEKLSVVFNKRPEMVNLYKGPEESCNTCEFPSVNTGFSHVTQLIDVQQEEIEPFSGGFQNVAQAEFIVACYCYMVLLGYPSSKITILTFYESQRILIDEVFQSRCAQWVDPPRVKLADEHRGVSSDYILLSLVRTRWGHFCWKDIESCVSAANLGLYIFGSKRFLDSFPVANKLSKILANISSTSGGLVVDGEKKEFKDFEKFGDWVYEKAEKAKW